MMQPMQMTAPPMQMTAQQMPRQMTQLPLLPMMQVPMMAASPPVKQPPPGGPRPPSGPPPLYEDSRGVFYFDVEHKKQYTQVFNVEEGAKDSKTNSDEEAIEGDDDTVPTDNEDEYEVATENGDDEQMVKQAMKDMIGKNGKLTEEASSIFKAMREEEDASNTGRKCKMRAGRVVQANRLRKLMQECYGVKKSSDKAKRHGKGHGKSHGQSMKKTSWGDNSGWYDHGSSSSSSWYGWRS